MGPSRGTIVRVENRYTLLFFVDQRASKSSLLVVEYGVPVRLHTWRDDPLSLCACDLFTPVPVTLHPDDPNPLLRMLAREHYLADVAGLRFARDSRKLPVNGDWVRQQGNASPLLGACRGNGCLQQLVVRRDWYLHFGQLCDDLRGTIPAFVRAS